MKKVLAFGTFDILHLGHVAYLRGARRYGSHLTVVIARDSAASDAHGHAPRFTARERAKLISELRCVDTVVIGNASNRIAVIRRIRPDVIALGYDHPIEVKALQSELVRMNSVPLPRIVRIRASRPDRYASRFVCQYAS